MNISLGVDHGALGLREALLEHLQANGHTVIDHGTHSADSVDYPDYATKVCDDVNTGKADCGVLCCTTGIGMSMSANKVPGIRAALLHFESEAALTRRHNNANVACFGAHHTTPYEACRIIDTFLANKFEGGRHERRVHKFCQFENQQSS
ncbi:MAG: ribose 5-phosphate isomerase B [Opitutales bacterium]|nr:ribose 5-phosphate isomerase B [Opitutales bacterium]